MLKLHLGCDKRVIPGFVHVDLADYPHIDYRHDIRTLPMFADGEVDLIYACHVLEYFDRVDVIEVLREWLRVLKTEGTLRLAVPDFAAMSLVYQEYSDLALIHGPLYGRWEVDQGEPKQVIYHRTVYDFSALRAVLETVGFKNIHRYDWRQTIHKDHDDYSQAYIPHMDKENGRLISLNVEASKG
jgi:predicted SAM-dependent methyltransferase